MHQAKRPRSNFQNHKARVKRTIAPNTSGHQHDDADDVGANSIVTTTVRTALRVLFSALKMASSSLEKYDLARCAPCLPAGRIKLVTDTLKAKQVTEYLDGSEDDLKPITNTIDKIVLARSVLQEQGLIKTDDVVFSQCEERMQAIAIAFEEAVDMLCGPRGDIMKYHSEIQTAGKYSEYFMQQIKDQTAQAEALTLSLEGLKRKGGDQLGPSFADGSMAQTCKSSMRQLIEDAYKSVTVGELLVWGH